MFLKKNQNFMFLLIYEDMKLLTYRYEFVKKKPKKKIHAFLNFLFQILNCYIQQNTFSETSMLSKYAGSASPTFFTLFKGAH